MNIYWIHSLNNIFYLYIKLVYKFMVAHLHDRIIHGLLLQVVSECVHTCRSLILFFEIFVRYWTLLAKCHDSDPTLTPISAVLRLLNAKDVNKSVTDFIIVMLDNLLSREEDEEMESITTATPVKVNKMMQISGKNIKWLFFFIILKVIKSLSNMSST